jgi:AraC-like DNA-binding protein
MTCSEIALNCGFNEQSYFNRLFLRKFGITPKQMREKNRNSPAAEADQ